MAYCRTASASGYYHSQPSNETLVWDRLVFSLMLTSFFAIVVAEFISVRGGRLCLAPMVLLGLYSVLYWRWSESADRGDLRLYLLVQFYPVIATPFIMMLFRSRYTRAGALPTFGPGGMKFRRQRTPKSRALGSAWESS